MVSGRRECERDRERQTKKERQREREGEGNKDIIISGLSVSSSCDMRGSAKTELWRGLAFQVKRDPSEGTQIWAAQRLALGREKGFLALCKSTGDVEAADAAAVIHYNSCDRVVHKRACPEPN